MKNHWDAFCTINYFLTGKYLLANATHSQAYYWYLAIEDRAYERSKK